MGITLTEIAKTDKTFQEIGNIAVGKLWGGRKAYYFTTGRLGKNIELYSTSLDLSNTKKIGCIDDKIMDSSQNSVIAINNNKLFVASRGRLLEVDKNLESYNLVQDIFSQDIDPRIRDNVKMKLFFDDKGSAYIVTKANYYDLQVTKRFNNGHTFSAFRELINLERDVSIGPDRRIYIAKTYKQGWASRPEVLPTYLFLQQVEPGHKPQVIFGDKLLDRGEGDDHIMAMTAGPSGIWIVPRVSFGNQCPLLVISYLGSYERVTLPDKSFIQNSMSDGRLPMNFDNNSLLVHEKNGPVIKYKSRYT